MIEVIGVVLLIGVCFLAYMLGDTKQKAKQQKELEVARQKMDQVPDSSKSDTANSLRDNSF